MPYWQRNLKHNGSHKYCNDSPYDRCAPGRWVQKRLHLPRKDQVVSTRILLSRAAAWVPLTSVALQDACNNLLYSKLCHRLAATGVFFCPDVRSRLQLESIALHEICTRIVWIDRFRDETCCCEVVQPPCTLHPAPCTLHPAPRTLTHCP